MAWAAENGYGLDLGQAQIPARRIAFANDISFAGRMAVDWVVDLVAKFEACIKQLGSECPIEFHDHWVNRDWPK